MNTLGIPLLLRNLSWNAARLCWVLVGLAIVETVPATDIYKWKLDEQPQKEKADQSAEGKSRAGCLSPDEEV